MIGTMLCCFVRNISAFQMPVQEAPRTGDLRQLLGGADGVAVCRRSCVRGDAGRSLAPQAEGSERKQNGTVRDVGQEKQHKRESTPEPSQPMSPAAG